MGFIRTDYPAGAGPELFAVGDLNHDGRPDLAVPDIYDNTVSYLLST